MYQNNKKSVNSTLVMSNRHKQAIQLSYQTETINFPFSPNKHNEPINSHNHFESLLKPIPSPIIFDDYTTCSQAQKVDYASTNNHTISKTTFLHYQDDEQQDTVALADRIGPAQEKQFNLDALSYDIKLGWMPRSQITGPIPLSFGEEGFDRIINNWRSGLVYLGPRPTNTFAVHGKYYNKSLNYPFHQFHLCKSQFLVRFFHQFYPEYNFTEERIPGMVKDSPLHFNSDYQGGNLDGVFYHNNQYRMLLRVDSNSFGHCLYYNFKVLCLQAGTYKFRIMNISKQKPLYDRGMHPYIKRGNIDWQQGCEDVTFIPNELCEEFQLTRPYSSLGFSYTFHSDGQQVQFCYAIPYNYSELLKDLQQKRSHPCYHLGKLCYSLSGIQIPLITITSPPSDTTNEMKAIIVITGRIHPSQTGGSHIINGILSSLLGNTKQAISLRKNVIFKIIPMLNPDGVIIGNTRTSFAGKDLNRKFMKDADFVFPEVNSLMDYVDKLKQKYNNQLIFLIDVHSHSSRKNSFFYGPQFTIMEEQYIKCRILPLFFSYHTDIFRYYSCRFKLSRSKQFTARGYFNSQGILAYTHQTSAHGYYDCKGRKDIPFTRHSLNKLGQQFVLAIHDYIEQTKRVNNNHQQKIYLAKLQEQLNIDMPKDEFEVPQENDGSVESDKADSQDQTDDFSERRLQQLYKKINDNRKQFYKELMKQDIEDNKTPKSKLKMPNVINKNNKQKAYETEQPQKQQLTVRASDKIDWVSKANYSPKKKSFEEYGKFTNLTFVHRQCENLDYSVKTLLDKPSSIYLKKQLLEKNIKKIVFEGPAMLTMKESKPPIIHLKKPLPQTNSIKIQKKRNIDIRISEFTSSRFQPVANTQSKISVVQDNEVERLLTKKKWDILNQPKKPIPEDPQQQSPNNNNKKYRHTKSISSHQVQTLPVCVLDTEALQRQSMRCKPTEVYIAKSVKVLPRKKSIKAFAHGDTIIKARKLLVSLYQNKMRQKLPSLASVIEKL